MHNPVVCRRRGNAERYSERNTSTRQQSGRCTVHVWGWVDGEGRGELYRIGRTTGASYKDLLEQQFLPGYDRLRPGREQILFQQDNAPIHTARVVRDWMERQPRLRLLPWASRSPDVNPIGNDMQETFMSLCGDMQVVSWMSGTLFVHYLHHHWSESI